MVACLGLTILFILLGFFSPGFAHHCSYESLLGAFPVSLAYNYILVCRLILYGVSINFVIWVNTSKVFLVLASTKLDTVIIRSTFNF